MNGTYHIFRKTETTGCEFEDGSDTRKTTTQLYIIPSETLENFLEMTASDYGDQDYGYRVKYREIAVFDYQEMGVLEQFWRQKHET